MIIDLFHNKIVKDIATDKFVESFHSVLVPMLTDKYGDSLEAVMMYEDYLADGMLLEGEWYYPLSVKLKGEPTIISWIKWPVNKKNFRNSIPYAYVGNESVDFSFAGFVPTEFADKLQGRAIDYDKGAIKISVEALTDDPMLLVGKYSQTFVDELARQITKDISVTLGVEGFENTTMELQLVFAPGTYLEHTSENVTYRRLLLVEKSCQARDFWVKWTRRDGEGGYRVSDHVMGERIVFKIGEDAAQKIREKEYRFLAGANPNKYQSAMGKKTVTEWRDIIKRALKREELVKVVSEVELAEHASSVFDTFAALKNAMASSDTAEKKVSYVTEKKSETVDPYDIVAALSKQMSSPVVETETKTDENDDIAALVRATLGVTAQKETVVTETSSEDEFEVEIVATEETDDETDIITPVFESLDTEDETDAEDGADEELFSISAYKDAKDEEETFSKGEVTFDEYVSVVTEAKDVEDRKVDEAALLREKEAQIRLEQETEARQKAEREAEMLRLEHERLLRENARLIQLAKEEEEKRIKEAEAQRLAEEERQRELAAKRAEEERLRAEAEARKRFEEQERARLAETARMAVEEQKRVEAERRARAERERQEALAKESERLRLEEEARRLDEERRREEQRKRDEERLQREEEERRRREAEAERARVQIVERRVNLIFRYNFDPNIIPRIKEITDSTIQQLNKGDVDIHIRAYPNDANSIFLNVKLPSNEMDLLVSIVKAIGNARIGVTKVSIE